MHAYGSGAAPGPLIHIGYHKTGTTWLQQRLFRNPQAGLSWGGKKEGSPVSRLVSVSPLDFDPEVARAEFAPYEAKAASKGMLHTVSLERLSGHPFTGGWDSTEIARKLHATFPRGRILIVVREQRSIILSTYRQYVRAGGAQPLRLFLDPPVYRSRTPHFDLRHFEYHRLLAFYHELFSEQNVLALPYEQLRSDPPAFAAAILHFAGLEADPAMLDALPTDAVNVGRRGAALRALRRVNRLFVRTDVNPLPLVPSDLGARAGRRLVDALERVMPARLNDAAERRLRATIADAVGDRYGESNRAWSRLTGIDLGSYGYDLGARPSVGAEDKALALR